VRAVRQLTVLVVLGSLASGCTLGDGEGGRYTGRVISASSEQICVGPNTSSPDKPTCAQVPPGVTDLPLVGQCVSLFGRSDDGYKTMSWSVESLHLKVEDSACAPPASGAPGTTVTPPKPPGNVSQDPRCDGKTPTPLPTDNYACGSVGRAPSMSESPTASP
jgi:hypothetical protein